jgi:hypothetical protein
MFQINQVFGSSVILSLLSPEMNISNEFYTSPRQEDITHNIPFSHIFPLTMPVDVKRHRKHGFLFNKEELVVALNSLSC